MPLTILYTHSERERDREREQTFWTCRIVDVLKKEKCTRSKKEKTSLHSLLINSYSEKESAFVCVYLREREKGGFNGEREMMDIVCAQVCHVHIPEW